MPKSKQKKAPIFPFRAICRPHNPPILPGLTQAGFFVFIGGIVVSLVSLVSGGYLIPEKQREK